jgi:hypothetical protein
VVVPIDGATELNPALASLFLSRAADAYRDPALPSDPLCFRSREDLFEWRGEPVGQLRAQMLAGICAAVKAANLYTEPEFDALGLQARARFAIVRPDGHIPASTSPMASWYALYCVAAPPGAPARADSGVLRLYAVRHGTMFIDAANCRLRPPFDPLHQTWRPIPGQMAVFPASILHEIALNRTDANLLLVGARVRFVSAGQDQQTMPPW